MFIKNIPYDYNKELVSFIEKSFEQVFFNNNIEKPENWITIQETTDKFICMDKDYYNSVFFDFWIKQLISLKQNLLFNSFCDYNYKNVSQNYKKADKFANDNVAEFNKLLKTNKSISKYV